MGADAGCRGGALRRGHPALRTGIPSGRGERRVGQCAGADRRVVDRRQYGDYQAATPAFRNAVGHGVVLSHRRGDHLPLFQGLYRSEPALHASARRTGRNGYPADFRNGTADVPALSRHGAPYVGTHGALSLHPAVGGYDARPGAASGDGRSDSPAGRRRDLRRRIVDGARNRPGTPEAACRNVETAVGPDVRCSLTPLRAPCAMRRGPARSAAPRNRRRP